MRKLVQVVLDGFKGLKRRYDIYPPTILTGPNGAGKSACLEAIVYALTGKLPAGKSLDTVATYFEPRGGMVQVQDEDGNVIERGIERDHKRAKVTELLDAFPKGDGEPPPLDEWYASPEVLNIQEFIGLSSDKRREFILRLCGGGKNHTNLFQVLEKEYAREIAGPAATAETLRQVSELPDDIHELAHAWTKQRGVGEVLKSYIPVNVDGKSLSEICLILARTAKENKLGARKAAKDSQAAASELELAAKGARAAASDIRAKKLELEKIHAELIETENLATKISEATHTQQTARASWEKAQSILDELEKRDVENPGKEPGMPTENKRISELKTELFTASKKLMEHKDNVQALLNRKNSLEQLRVEMERERGSMALMESSPWTKILAHLALVPDEADVLMPVLREEILEASRSWVKQRNEQSSKYNVAINRYDKELHNLAYIDGDLEDARDKVIDSEGQIKAIQDTINRYRDDDAAVSAKYNEKIAAWHTANRKWANHQAQVHTVTGSLHAAQKAQEQAENRLKALGEGREAYGKAERLNLEFAQAQRAFEEAETAAGAVEAYEAALERGRLQEIEGEAWKHAENAVKAVREELVGIATQPMLEDINGILRAAGREEHVYLELENDRGRPIFELGWIHKDQRTAFQALSSGEAVIFCAALSVAIARRALGRKILLIEADPLDRENLEALFRALGPQKDQFEALCVATAAVGWERPEGWRILEL